MFRIIARLCVLTCCCLFVTPGAFAEETPKITPDPNGNNCYYVNVYIHGEKQPKVTNSGVVCNHGSLSEIGQLSPHDTRVILSQDLPYGPDCLITITSGDQPHQSTAVLRVQQNYCFREGGDLHPDIVSGPAEITHFEPGSYEGNQPGQVWVFMNPKGGNSPR